MAVRYILFSLLCVLISGCLAAATTVTGTLQDLSGTAIYAGRVTFELRNYGTGNIPRVQGTNIIVQTTPIVAYTNTSGQFSVQVQDNLTITPSTTYYYVSYYNGNTLYLAANYTITGTTMNITMATPLNVIPAVPPYTAYTTIEHNGSALTQRQILNFTSNVSCSDDPSNASTDCSSTGGGGGGGASLDYGYDNSGGSSGLTGALTGTTFTLSSTPINSGSLFFYVNGLLQQGGSGTTYDYNWSGTTITCCYASGVLTAPGNNANLQAIWNATAGSSSGVNDIAYSTTPNLDMSKGNVQQFDCTTAGASITPTTANLTAGQIMTFVFIQNGTTACTVTFPSNMHGATAVGSTLNGINTEDFVVTNNGTDLYAVPAQNMTGGTP